MHRFGKRFSLISLFLIVIFSITPAFAQSDESSTLAEMMPSNISFFVEVSTSDIPGALDTVYDLYPGMAEMIGMTPDEMFDGVDVIMSSVFGDEFSLEDDLLAILGDSIAIGYDVDTNHLLNQYYEPDVVGQAVNADLIFAAAISDQQKMVELIEAILALDTGIPFEPLVEEDLNGQTVSIFQTVIPTNEEEVVLTVAVTPEYLIMGTDKSVELAFNVVSGESDSLLESETFGDTMTTLESGSLARLFVSGSLINDIAEASEAEEEWIQILSGLNSIGMAVYADDTQLSIEYVHDYDFSLVRELLPDLPEFDINPVTMAIAAQLPEKTMSVAMWSDPAGIYEFVRDAVPALAPIAAPLSYMDEDEYEEEVRAGFEEFEALVLEEIGLDLNADVLPWAGGEMASFVYHNPQSDIQCVGGGVWQFDQGYILNVTDSDSASAAVDQVSNALNESLQEFEDGEVEVEDGIYFVDAGFDTHIMWGVVEDSIVISNGSAMPHIQASIAGETGSLADNPVWMYASENFPADGRMPVAFANLVEFEAALRAMNISDPDFQLAIEALVPFESASIFINQPGNGTFHLTAQVLFRRDGVNALPSLPEREPLVMTPPEPTYEDGVAQIEPTLATCSSTYAAYGSNFAATEDSLTGIGTRYLNYDTEYLVMWDALTGEVLVENEFDTWEYYFYSLSLNGDQSLAYSYVGEVLDVETGELVFELPDATAGRVVDTFINYDGSLLGTVYQNNTEVQFEIWNLESGEKVLEVEHEFEEYVSPHILIWDAEDSFIMETVGGGERNVYLYNPENEEFESLYDANYAYGEDATVSNDGTLLGFGTDYDVAGVISVESGELLHEFPGISQVIFSPDGELMILYDYYGLGAIEVRDVENGELVAELQINGYINDVRFGADGQVVIAENYEFVIVWHLPDDLSGE